MVLDGHSRCWPRSHAMDRQTLRDWVHRYNADGLAGLADRPRLGVSLVWPKPAERSGEVGGRRP